jgi:hypothetical protein
MELIKRHWKKKADYLAKEGDQWVGKWGRLESNGG